MAQGRVCEAVEARREQNERNIQIKTRCLRLTMKNLQDMLDEEKRKLEEEKNQVEGMAKEQGLVLIDPSKLKTTSTPVVTSKTSFCHDYPVTKSEPKSNHVCHDYQVKHDWGDSAICKGDIPQREFERYRKGYEHTSFDHSSEQKLKKNLRFQAKANNLNHNTPPDPSYTQATKENREQAIPNHRVHQIHLNNQTFLNHFTNNGTEEAQSSTSDDTAINGERFEMKSKREDKVIDLGNYEDPTSDNAEVAESDKFQNVISSTEEFIRNKLDQFEEDKQYMESVAGNYLDRNTNNEDFLRDYYDRFQQNIVNNGCFGAVGSGDYQRESYNTDMTPEGIDQYDWSGIFMNGDHMNSNISNNSIMDKPNLDCRQGDAGMNLPHANKDQDWEPLTDFKSDLINSHKYTTDWLYKETTNITAETTYTVGFVNEIIDNSGSVFADDRPYVTRTSYFQQFSSDPVFAADTMFTDNVYTPHHSLSSDLDYSSNLVYPESADPSQSCNSMHASQTDTGLWSDSNARFLNPVYDYTPNLGILEKNTLYSLNSNEQYLRRSPLPPEHLSELIHEADDIAQRIQDLNNRH